jgi:hypothetical protein
MKIELWLTSALVCGGASAAASQEPFDLVIRGGRVIDPETRIESPMSESAARLWSPSRTDRSPANG